MGEIGAELSKIAENYFEETTYAELGQQITIFKTQINTWTVNYGMQNIFNTSIINQAATTQLSDNDYNNIIKKLRNPTQSTEELNNILGIPKSDIIHQLFLSEESIKEGYSILNQVADYFHGYSIEYEVHIPIGDMYYTYRLNLSEFINTLQLNNSGTDLYIGANRSVYGIKKDEAIRAGMSKSDFIKDFQTTQLNTFFENAGISRSDFIEFVSREELLSYDDKMGIAIEEINKNAGTQFKQPKNLAFYRGPDYIKYINGVFNAYIQSKLITASVSVNAIANGMRRLIILLDTLEQRISPQISSATEKIKTISEDKIVQQLIESVFSF